MKTIMLCGVDFKFDIDKIVDAISKVSIRTEEAEIVERLNKSIKKRGVLLREDFGAGKTNSSVWQISGINELFPSAESELYRTERSTRILNSVMQELGANKFDFCSTYSLVHSAMHELYYYNQKATVLDNLYLTVSVEIEQLKKRREVLRRLRKLKTARVSTMIRAAWLNRNLAVGRSSTSTVSDLMLLSIPTPPTFKAANRSLEVGGAVVAFR